MSLSVIRVFWTNLFPLAIEGTNIWGIHHLSCKERQSAARMNVTYVLNSGSQQRV
jgi:hypothetical protein